jgi:hypothetical protein
MKGKKIVDRNRGPLPPEVEARFAKIHALMRGALSGEVEDCVELRQKIAGALWRLFDDSYYLRQPLANVIPIEHGRWLRSRDERRDWTAEGGAA